MAQPHNAQLGFAERVIDGVEVIVPPVCDVPAGEFLMGSDPARDEQAPYEEKPRHPVTLPAFRIGRYTVTVAEYACFVRTGHAEPKSTYGSPTWQQQLGKLDHPVVNVSRRDAVAYAVWLAQLTGAPWRLPSEAEWEKAARWDPAARTSHIYPWGDEFDNARCNTSAVPFAISTGTTPVGSYPSGASPYGAQDMAGNVFEWTSSLYKPYPYRADDGRERADSTGSRVLRGGSWDNVPLYARAACRNHSRPGYCGGNYGFRVAVAAVPSA